MSTLGLKGSVAHAGPENILWVVDDDTPPYMMASMPLTRREIRDPGSNFTSGHGHTAVRGPRG